jgi:hypothetical protein
VRWLGKESGISESERGQDDAVMVLLNFLYLHLVGEGNQIRTLVPRLRNFGKKEKKRLGIRADDTIR